eukprot:13704295-Ditylum_brightwellii.AAC.1
MDRLVAAENHLKEETGIKGGLENKLGDWRNSYLSQMNVLNPVMCIPVSRKQRQPRYKNLLLTYPMKSNNLLRSTQEFLIN